jgi:glycerol kinase
LGFDLGITNQRETAVVWDKKTGKSVSQLPDLIELFWKSKESQLTNAIAWPDTRNTHTVRQLQHKAQTYPFKTPSSLSGEAAIKELTGLPISTYFAGVKLRWMLDNLPEVREAADQGRLLFGTVESYLTWHFTGGLEGGVHVTDYVNASRTLLLNFRTLEWEEQLIDFLEVRKAILPKLVSNTDVVGKFKVRGRDDKRR